MFVWIIGMELWFSLEVNILVGLQNNQLNLIRDQLKWNS